MDQSQGTVELWPQSLPHVDTRLIVPEVAEAGTSGQRPCISVKLEGLEVEQVPDANEQHILCSIRHKMQRFRRTSMMLQLAILH